LLSVDDNPENSNTDTEPIYFSTDTHVDIGQAEPLLTCSGDADQYSEGQSTGQDMYSGIYRQISTIETF